MSDETTIGSAGAPDGGGPDGGGSCEQSPLQTRAAFIKNWSWDLVISLNRGACESGRALHGVNSETGETCEAAWEASRLKVLTLGEALDLLKGFHRKAPFLFFNGNTFAEMKLVIGLRAAAGMFGEVRKR